MGEKKPFVVEFEGWLSGDYECFVFAVEKETFERVLGRSVETDRLGEEDTLGFNVSRFDKRLENGDVVKKENLYNLYIDDILESRGIDDYKTNLQSSRKVRVKLEFEEIRSDLENKEK